MRRILKKVKKRYIILALVGLILASLSYYRLAYPGFSVALVNQLLDCTWDENKNLYGCVGYWLATMEQLEFDEETGLYSFEKTDVSSRDGFVRGKVAYHRGRFADAIESIQTDITRSGETESKVFWLAMSHLRLAETENCLVRLGAGGSADVGNVPDCCTEPLCSLPLLSHHARPTHSHRAAELFEQLLKHYDANNRLYQWLFNFARMTTGAFPESVPPQYRIDSPFIDAFHGERKKAVHGQYAYLSLEDRAKAFGVDTFNTGRGLAVEDFDKDGYLDLITANTYDGLRYFKNEGGKVFVDRTVDSGLTGVKQPFMITAADYDNDGWIDLFVGCPFGTYRLFRNNMNGTFTDVTASSGLLDAKPAGDIAATWVSAWADVNNDGKLDLFLAQWGMKLPGVKGVMAKPRMDSKLFINENGHFVDRTKEYGLAEVVQDGYFIGAAFGDYDRDGYPDLFLSSPLRKTSVLLRNVGGKRFEKTSLIDRTEGGFVAAFLDMNHDGLPDIFQSGFADARTSTEMTVFGDNLRRYHSGHSTILMQSPGGRFEERNDLFDMPMGTMGASYGDLNNDGLHDFYLGKGTPESWFILPNLLYMSESEGTRFAGRMTNVSMLHGLGTVQKGHAIVFADFNNDGLQDIYSCLGGMWPGDPWRNQLFINSSKTANAWSKLRLRGRQTNYYGVGACIKLIAENERGEEIIRYYHMDNKTGFGSAPYLAHIGLMNAVTVKSASVYWPVSRQWRQYEVKLRSLTTLDEGEGICADTPAQD
jgi:hypothetical protein